MSSLFNAIRGQDPSPSQSSSSNQAGSEQNVDDIDEEGEEQHNIIMSIISSLRPGSDLSRITLPTFILERKSMLERITNQLCHPDLLLKAHETEDPEDRFMEVLGWYLSGWHIAPKAVKKPLNPILTEYFTCYWDMPNHTKAFYIAEQTSHHPPKSSYFYFSPENHIRVDGIVIPRSRFLGNSAASMMDDSLAVLTFYDRQDPNDKTKSETYELTQPNMYARGILFGRLKLELGDHVYVNSPALDLTADIEFKTKGFISGTYNAIAGKVYRTSTKETLFELSGKWTETVEAKDVRTGKKQVLFTSVNDKPMFPKVRSLELQSDRESRKLWKKVTDALARRDHSTATNEKFSIEELQRDETRKREEDGVEFEPRFFRRVNGPLEYEFALPLAGAPSAEGHDKSLTKSPKEEIDELLNYVPIVEGQQANTII